MKRAENTTNTTKLSMYLSPVTAWALAFGCAVGWGSFMMPGTTFLPIAGPVGSLIGLLIGALIMVIIGVNYRSLMTRYPDAGGAYTYAGKILGSDHGFLCAWMLILTYMAVLWANCTALALICRYLFGDVFCFGFSYEIAGYTIYLGEVLLSIALFVVTALVCIVSKRLAGWLQVLFALMLFGGICVAFVAVVIRCGGFAGLSPAFSSEGTPVTQALGIVILAPWAYIGFESISHSAEEFRFPVRRSLPVMIAALITGALSYVMLVLCAGMAVPDGFADWGEYIKALVTLDGVEGLPTFHAAREAMGSTGLYVLGMAAFGGVMTGLIGNYIALSRLLYKMASDRMIPQKFSALNKRGVPYFALMIAAGVSCIIQFFGRTAVSWIVDVTTIGAVIVYTYVSVAAFIIGRREHRTPIALFGGVGAVISLIFAVIYLMPALWQHTGIAAQSYLILIIWSILGMLVFRIMIQRDRSRRLGKSEIVWMVLSFLVLLVSTIWIQQSTEQMAVKISGDVTSVYIQRSYDLGFSPNSEGIGSIGDYITDRIIAFGESVHSNILLQGGLIVCALAIIFSIFSVIKKREQKIEAERLLAEENSRSKSTFLSNMSHDLRTPINAVIGYTALAKEEEGVPEKVRDYLQKIEDSGQHLLLLINDVLDMSRIESGKVELDPEPCDLRALIDGVHTVFSVQMKEKNLDFPIACDVVNPYVVCDKNRLNRVMLNLVSNAYKFTPKGGRVSLSLRQLNDDATLGEYEIIVEDTGIGMSEEFVKHIFNAFERERTSTVSGIQGTGLGMSITKSLVELMGGAIRVDTEKDKGTRFTICLQLPAADENEIRMIEKSEASEAEQRDFTGKKLLLVEDNPINREIACTILEARGFSVDTAENGQIAVDMIADQEEDTYDAVLMDIQMPVMNGYDASRAIRAMLDDRSQVPIIALTANTFEEDRRNIMDAGMDAYVFKPFTPDDLIAAVGKYVK